MSGTTYTIELPFSVVQIWGILNTVEKWAPLLESYVSHEIIDDTESIWTFKGNIGLMKKKISAKVKIVEWNDLTKVAFYVTGVNEKFSGYGYIETKDGGEEKSIVTIFQDITVKGALKVVTGPLTKSPSSKKRKKVEEDITKKIKKAEELLKESNVLVD